MRHALLTALYAALAIIGGLSLTGCVATSGDIRDLADRVEEYEDGALTDAEFAAALELKAREVEERAKAAAAAVAEAAANGPAGWLKLIGGVVASAGAAGYGVNRHRDTKRRMRGEAVDAPRTGA